MKPDWKDAPSWANYVAMDRDGDWFWHEFEPSDDSGICWGNKGRAEAVNFIESWRWRETLESRPKK